MVSKEEITKALECCTNDGYNCVNCYFSSENHRYDNGESVVVDEKGTTYDDYDCSYWLMKSALNLLKQ